MMIFKEDLYGCLTKSVISLFKIFFYFKFKIQRNQETDGVPLNVKFKKYIDFQGRYDVFSETLVKLIFSHMCTSRHVFVCRDRLVLS